MPTPKKQCNVIKRDPASGTKRSKAIEPVPVECPHNLLTDSTKPWIAECLQKFKEISALRVALNVWLDTAIKDAGGLHEWARKLDECFPPEECVDYLTANKLSGDVRVRFWQLASHPDTNLSGLIMNEARALALSQ
jgi:hypothetical protein